MPIWSLSEAREAINSNSWPVSRSSGFSVSGPSSQNASCSLSASLSGSGTRSTGWGDPISFEWQKSTLNSPSPSTGNPWLSEYFSWGSSSPLNAESVFASGVSPPPRVAVSYQSSTPSDPLFSQVSLLVDFENGCHDRSNSQKWFLVRGGGSPTTSAKRSGSRSFSGGRISYYGDSKFSGDFTAEGWYWLADTSSRRLLFSVGTMTSGGSHLMAFVEGGHVYCQAFGGDAVKMASSVVDTQDWVHVALVRSDSTLKVYVNGLEAGSTSKSGTIGDDLSPGNLILSAASGDYLDEFRVTNSARYSEEFSPPVGEFCTGGLQPVVIVSGAGSAFVNGTYLPVSSSNPKQAFEKQDACVFWDSAKGFWAIAASQAVSSGNWVYASDGNCWLTTETVPASYLASPQSLSLSGLSYSDHESAYRIKAKSGFNEATSPPATITVEPIAVWFSSHPTDQFASAGSLTFSATATSAGSITGQSYGSISYQWQKYASGSWSNVSGQTSSSITINGLSYAENGDLYRLRATACNSDGVAYSNPATVRVGSPSQPTGLVGVAGSGEVSLSWTAPSSAGDYSIADYEVQYSSDNGVNWTTFSEGLGTSTSATVTGLTNGNSYLFRVAAISGNGVTFSLKGPYSLPTQRVIASASTVDPFLRNVSFVSNFGSLIDQSLSTRDVSVVGDTVVSTAQSKWGSSAYFDGDGDYLSVEDPNAFKIGSQDFTAEVWVYKTANPAWERAFVTTADPIDGSGFLVGLAGNGNVFWAIGGGGWQFVRESVSLANNQWHHVAVCRSEGVARLYVGGILRDSQSFTAPIPNVNQVLRIGGRNGGSQYFPGYIGGARLTKGVDRYPRGATFAVPVTEFTAAGVGSAVPGTPTGVTATKSTRSSLVSWTKPAANGSGITGHVIQYSSDNGASWSSFAAGKSSSATVTGLLDNTEYIFRVAAVNYVGSGTYSQSTTPVRTNSLPGTPTSVSAVAGNGEVSLSWTAPASSGDLPITDYAVQYSANSGSTWTTASEIESPISSTTIRGLSNGTAYTFRVAAVSAVGAGPYSSASGSATPSSSLPLSPDTSTSRPGSERARVSWPASTSGGVTGYAVEVRPAGGSPFTVSTSDTSLFVTSLTNGVQYAFRVAAVNSSGTGAYSPPSIATPVSLSPTAVILTEGDTYTLPSGTNTLKIWTVGVGTDAAAGSVAYKAWVAVGGTQVSYSCSDPCTATYDGATISAGSGYSEGAFSGGDGGSAGGLYSSDPETGYQFGGSVGGNSQSLSSPCQRRPASTVSGLLAAVALAGGKANEDCGEVGSFGSGGFWDPVQEVGSEPGIGGGSARASVIGGPAAVVILVT